MDNLEPPAAPSNVPEFSVSELSFALKRQLEGAFPRVRVRGEISQPSFPRSGHCYFRLKDEDAVLDAVCWKMVPRVSLAKYRVPVPPGVCGSAIDWNELAGAADVG